MEVCLEAEGLEGCFVAVRVGDVQKLSRYNPAQSLRFPERKKSVKVDIFRRIGACEVRVDRPSNGDSQVCNIKQLENSLDELQLRCTTRLVEPIPEIPEMSQVLSSSSDNVRFRDPKASSQASSKKYLAKTQGPHGVEEMVTGAMQSLLKKKPETAPAAPLLSDYFAQKDAKKDLKFQEVEAESTIEDHFPILWPVDDDHVSQKLTPKLNRSTSTGVLDNRSCSRQSHRPCSRQDERPCSRQSNRPSSRQSFGCDERPCSRRSSLETDSRPPSRQSRRPSLSRGGQGMSRGGLLAPLEKAPPLPEVVDQVPLDVEVQHVVKPTCNYHCSARAGPSKPFPEYYKENIAPSCGKPFWSSLHAKFAKVEKEVAPASVPKVPTLAMPFHADTAGVSRPGSAGGSRTPKPQVLLSGGKLRVLGETALETGRFRRPDSAGSIREEVHLLTERSARIRAKEASVPCLECLTVN